MTTRPVTTRATIDDAGFSLVEALITLTIIAVMTIALFGTVTADARARQMVRQRRTALMIAQSELDRAAGGQTEDSGQSLGLEWRIDRESYGDSQAFAHNRLELLIVSVVDADHHALARLATLRIAP